MQSDSHGARARIGPRLVVQGIAALGAATDDADAKKIVEHLAATYGK